MKKFYKIRNVLHQKIGYLQLESILKALFWASQIASEGGAAGIIEIWTSETCRQKKINCNRAEFLHGSIICHNEAENLLSKSIWDKIQKSCCPIDHTIFHTIFKLQGDPNMFKLQGVHHHTIFNHSVVSIWCGHPVLWLWHAHLILVGWYA